MSHFARPAKFFDIELEGSKPCARAWTRLSITRWNCLWKRFCQRGKNCRGRHRKSGNIGQKISRDPHQHRLDQCGAEQRRCLHGDLGIVNDGDIIMALSYSGESEELLNLIRALKRFSFKIISFTGATHPRWPATATLR